MIGIIFGNLFKTRYFSSTDELKVKEMRREKKIVAEWNGTRWIPENLSAHF